MSLKDLNQLGISSQNLFLEYNKEEVKLSNDFKELFTKIIEKKSKDKVVFSDYTTIVRTPKELTITFPNQWFYISSFFVDYLNSLKKFKSHSNIILNGIPNIKDVLSDIKRTKRIPVEIEKRIENHFENDEDINYFTKFLSNYDWWFGSKTIDRGDYFISPILNLAQVVNASQSYIAEITYLLSDNPELVDYLKQSEVSKKVPKNIDDVEYDDLKEKFADWFIALDGVRHNYFTDNFNSKKEKFLKEITKYENIYKEQFKKPVFSYVEHEKDDFISNLEKNLYKEEGLFFSFSQKKSTHMPRAILGKRNYLAFLKEYDFSSSRILQTNFDLSNFQKDCNSAGLIYSDQLITRFVSSLVTKPFLILTGLSGSGKTKLAQAFVQWVCQCESQYRVIPVGADWTNREPLLGYPNALDPNDYVKPDNDVINLILRANQNEHLPYFLILDEMNLSHVERYFADFLSVMESGEEIPLHDGKEDKNGVPPKLKLPSNLFIIGTVNIDETTNMFSPKVLDRANTIEFRIDDTEMGNFLNSMHDLNMNALLHKGTNMAESFVNLSSTKSFETQDVGEINTALLQFFGELKKTGAEFGYRTASEIMRLIHQVSVLDPSLTTEKKVDIAIMQKLLPKLHGSRRKLCPILETLGGFCLKNKENIVKNVFENKDFQFTDNKEILYPLSLEKISRMYNGAIDNGFTSFAEA